jgi:predicted Zn finger-like uncharacterized protein
MKIVCDNCGAKYSIADEKVAGKVFKIRCKKCSEVIVVRGDQVASDEDEATRVFDYGSEAVWHVVVNGEQQGPYAPLQLGGLLNEGTIDWDTYVWKEGFDGWKPIRDVSELTEAINGGGAPPMAATPADEMPTTVTSGEPKADLFASSADASFSGGGAAAKPAGGDLFASPEKASPFEADDQDEQDVVASQPSPRVSAQQASMTGQRNENSVLFSLSNLQALATGTEAAAPKAAKASAPAPAAAPAASSLGHAMGEGSGLIDIRALASAASSPKPAASASAGAAVDDLLSIGTGPALGGALGAPMLAPAVEKESSGPNLKVLYGAVGVLGIGLVAAVAFMMTREPQQIVVTQEVPAAAPAPTGASEPAAAPTTVVQGGDTAAQPTEVATATPEPSDDEPSASSRDNDRDRARTAAARERTSASSMQAAASTSSSSMSESSSSTAMSDTSSSSMRSGDLDSLMGQVIGMSAMESSSASASSGLPEQPSRDAVRRALGGRSAAVQACGNGAGGTAMAAVTFSGSGSVSSVRVTGVSGSIAGCVSSAVRQAHVPPFSRPSFNVTFPYRL